MTFDKTFSRIEFLKKCFAIRKLPWIDTISSEKYLPFEALGRLKRAELISDECNSDVFTFKGFVKQDKKEINEWVLKQMRRSKVVYKVSPTEDWETVLVAYPNSTRRDWAERLITEKLGDVQFEKIHSRGEGEKEKRVIRYELSPEYKAPSGLKKPELVSYLQGQAKEALTKIYNRSEVLREAKKKQLEIRRQLTQVEKELKEKRTEISEELSGLIKMADKAFSKLGFVENTAYVLETKEDIILTAIRDVILQEIPDRPPVPKSAEGILAILVNMGKLTEEMVHEAEAKIDELNTDIKYVEEVSRTLYLFPPTEREREGKIALSLRDIWTWLRSKYEGAKEFLGFVNSSVEELQELHKHLEDIVGEVYRESR